MSGFARPSLWARLCFSAIAVIGVVGACLASMGNPLGYGCLSVVMSFAVGVYLPLSTTFPIFVGGMLKGLVDRIQGVKDESEVSPGMLYSTGLVAGGEVKLACSLCSPFG